MLKYLSKFTMDILPSVAATIIGAYVVNHYITSKPATDAPVAAALSPADPKKADAKPAGTSSDVANIPEAGVRAKGISEKAIFEKPAVEKPAEKSAAEKSPAEKSEDRPAETASIPPDTRRRQPAPREKTVAKIVPAPVQPAAPAVAPAVAAPPPPVEAAIAPEEHRDANDLARAAIERLRGVNDGSPRTQEAARTAEPPRGVTAPQVSTPPQVSTQQVSAPQASVPSVRPLPPPIMVSTPAGETFDPAAGSSQPTKQPYPTSARIDDPRRPTPPADIPDTAPLDLRAEAAEPATREHEHRTVAEDVLSAAKSVFHAVLPK
jgi:hypothetical protein